MVYRTIGYPTDVKRNIIINCAKSNNMSLNSIYQTLNTIVSENNLSNSDILRELTNYYGQIYILEYKKKKQMKKSNSKSEIREIRFNLTEQNKLIDLFDKLAQIEINLSTNTNSYIHLMAISSCLYMFNNKKY